MWFEAFIDSPDGRFVSFRGRLLEGSAAVTKLLATNPFPDHPPHFIRAAFFRYRFAPRGTRDTWQRSRVGQYLPPVSLDDPEFLDALRAYRLED